MPSYKSLLVKYDYRHILKSEFDRRSSVNPSYSLRAFARDLDIQAPQLSAVLLGKKGLSSKKASTVAKTLGFSKTEEKKFVAAVSAAHARSKLGRETAHRKLHRLDKSEQIATVEAARFEVVADWYHMALLQLMETRNFRWNIQEIAKTLGISIQKTEAAIEALVLTGLLKQSAKGYAKSDDFIRTEDVPSRAIRLSLQQLIAKAATALEQQSIQERDFSSVTVAIDRSRLPEMKSWLTEFREKFCLEACQGDNRNDVYTLNLQFFKLIESQTQKEKNK